MKKLFFVACLLVSSVCFAGDKSPAPSPWLPDGSGGITTDRAVSAPSVTMGSAASGLIGIPDADGVVLTSADWGKTIWMTGPGEVVLPDGTPTDLFKYIIVIVRDAAEQVEVALTDTTEIQHLNDGTALDAGDETNMSTTKLSKTTFVYMETGKWYPFGSTVTDGGVAD